MKTRDNFKKNLVIDSNNKEVQLEHFKEYRKGLSQININDNNNYYSQKIVSSKNNYMKTWRILKEAKGYKTFNTDSKINSILVNRVSINDNRAIAECINNYFTNIGIDMSKKLQTTATHTILMKTKYALRFLSHQWKRIN